MHELTALELTVLNIVTHIRGTSRELFDVSAQSILCQNSDINKNENNLEKIKSFK